MKPLKPKTIALYEDEIKRLSIELENTKKKLKKANGLLIDVLKFWCLFSEMGNRTMKTITSEVEDD